MFGLFLYVVNAPYMGVSVLRLYTTIIFENLIVWTKNYSFSGISSEAKAGMRMPFTS